MTTSAEQAFMDLQELEFRRRLWSPEHGEQVWEMLTEMEGDDGDIAY